MTTYIKRKIIYGNPLPNHTWEECEFVDEACSLDSQSNTQVFRRLKSEGLIPPNGWFIAGEEISRELKNSTFYVLKEDAELTVSSYDGECKIFFKAGTIFDNLCIYLDDDDGGTIDIDPNLVDKITLSDEEVNKTWIVCSD